ncbi:MAG: potassium-transporting ATPase subunit KdpA [Chloroflexi bacterium]|nr:potassium-transporting ATPase subunit KdpA [Chloroflexota bacterium]
MLPADVLIDSAQILALLALITLLTKPLGGYMAKVYLGERTLLSPLLSPVERTIYRLAGIDEKAEMGWKQYAIAMLLFNMFGILLLYSILLLQGGLPFNPQKFPGFSWHLALNTAVSFVTNTNWQAYSGESAASYFTQAAGLAVQNFLSSATGMAVMIALIRGFSRRMAENIGNFWADLTRGALYILLPIALAAALLLVSQGVIQNFSPYLKTTLLQPIAGPGGRIIAEQTLPMGPVASQEAIKELGTNGGGFFNANSSHPYENPTPFTNAFEIFLILLIPAALTNTFGRMCKSQRDGWAIYATMMFLLVIAVGALYMAELGGNPLLALQGPNMEGKDVRFGLGGSALFSATTTATSCGAVNTMHDSLTPLGGMVPLLLMLLGEVVFGGVGSGLYTMLAFVVIAVFTAGLMIGRTPEYLGKKIEITEMWTSVITVFTAGILILILDSIALVTTAGTGSILNPGAHGLSEILYAFASPSNNNGSAFAGLNANTVFYNVLLSVAMLGGRFIPAVAVLWMAGSLVRKKYIPPSVGTLPTDGLFIAWLAAVILIVGALTFFPALSLGPIVEHMIMSGGY